MSVDITFLKIDFVADDTTSKEGETECNPNDFYPIIEESWWESFITKMINFFLAILILSYSPFIIYLPFRRKTLNTCCRKIISMIVISDVISTLAHMELLLFRPWNETNTSLCLIATITLAVAQHCSLHWSFALLIYVLCTVKKKVKRDRSKNTFFFVCHILIWPSGLVMVLLYFLIENTISFHNDLLTVNSCRPDYHFILIKNDTECSAPPLLLQIFIGHLSHYFLVAFLSVLLFFTVLITSYRYYKKEQEAIKKSPVKSIHEFTRKLSYDVHKQTFRFGASAFVYIIGSLPINVSLVLLVLTRTANISDVAKAYHFFYKIYPTTIATINVICYGVFSPLIMEETKLSVQHFSVKVKKLLYDYENESVDDYKSAEETVSLL